MKSLASARGGDGSRRCRITLRSSGSPGTTDQWSNTCEQNAWPSEYDRKSVSKPKLTSTMNAGDLSHLCVASKQETT